MPRVAGNKGGSSLNRNRDCFEVPAFNVSSNESTKSSHHPVIPIRYLPLRLYTKVPPATEKQAEKDFSAFQRSIRREHIIKASLTKKPSKNFLGNLPDCTSENFKIPKLCPQSFSFAPNHLFIESLSLQSSSVIDHFAIGWHKKCKRTDRMAPLLKALTPFLKNALPVP